MKKIVLLCSVIFVFIISLKTYSYAFREIGNYGVDITYALNEYKEYEIRNSEYEISDSGRMNQQYDTIDFNNVYEGKYSIDDLKKEGYYTMAIEISLDVKRVNDGYRHIFLYDDASRETFLTGCTFEYKSKNYSKLYFYTEVSIFNIKNNDFVIRYGASGKLADTWQNTNLNIQIGFSKEAPKTSNIWKISWLNDEHTKYEYECLSIAK